MDRDPHARVSRIQSRVVLGLGVAVIALVAWLLAIPSGRPLSGEWSATDADRADAVRIVRETLREKAAADAGARPRLRTEHRPVHVTLYSAKRAGTVTALRENVAASLVEAAKHARAATGTPVPEDDMWFRVDVETAEQPLSDPSSSAFARLLEPGASKDALEAVFEPGVDGIRVEAEGEEGVVLPSDPVTEGWWSPYRDLSINGRSLPATRGALGLQVISIAKGRLARKLGHEAVAPRIVRFRTDAFLAAAHGDGAPIALFRGMPDRTDTPTPEEIRASLDAGAGWLVATLGTDGRFTRYTYVPHRDAADPNVEPYNVIRHIASAWALEKLGRRFARADWIDAGDRALAWVEPSIVPAGRELDGVPQYVLAAPDATRGGLGETATAVLALAERGDSLDATGRAKLAGLGATLEWMLRDDGGFYESEAEATKRGPKDRDFLLYEPGEALLALATLAELRPGEKHWLAAARRAAAYQSECFEGAWRGVDCYGEEREHGFARRLVSIPDRLPSWVRVRFVDRIHWQTQALDRMARLTGERRYAETAVAMGNAILMTASPPNQVAQAPDGTVIGPLPKDYAGAFPFPGGVPRTVATGSRAEALNAARRAAIFLGRDPRPFESALVRLAGFQIRNQYDDTSCYWCKAPEHAKGAFRGGLTDGSVRIDFVQHIIASMADTLEWDAPATSARSTDR